MTNRTKIAALVGVPALLGSASTFAALGTEVTTAISDAQADIVTVGGLLIALGAVVLGLKWVKAMFF
jgi:hypothetical protein